MKKTNAKKKLIPAAAMLAISAAMLSTATYAWFTMSRDVSVTGIDMTATVPAGLQISLGKGQGAGTLDVSDTNAAIGSKVVTAPENTDTSVDWTNTVNFSDFYFVGKLAPASSNTGEDIFYTKDATVVGKTVASNATFRSAITSQINKDLEFAFVEPKNGTVAESDVINATGSDGYYIDVPVWFRNADSSAANLKVIAVAKSLDNSSNVLYKAARVSILNSEGTTTSKLILPHDGDTTTATAAAYYGDKKNTSNGNVVANGAIAKEGTIGGSINGIYVNVKDTTNGTVYNETSAVVTVPGTTDRTVNTTTLYGNSVKYTVRIWLEGEDVSCYNANAGQKFSISLYFSDVNS